MRSTDSSHDHDVAPAPQPEGELHDLRIARRISRKAASSGGGDTGIAAAAFASFGSAINAGIHPASVQRAATHGLSGTGGSLPHLATIQRAFGRHDVTGVTAHVGGAAAEGAAAMGARGYATDGQVAFAASPDLHLASHEAAHVVQQRGGVQLSGGVSSVGDPYEQHADAVADAVVRGERVEALLDVHAGSGGGGGGGGVQRDETDPPSPSAPTPAPSATAGGDDAHADDETAAADAEVLARVREAVPEIADEIPVEATRPPRSRHGRRGRHGARTAATPPAHLRLPAAAPGSTAARGTHARPDREIMHPDRDVSAEFSTHEAEARARFDIPEDGFAGERLGHSARIDVSDTLRALVTRIRQDPSALEHIRTTIAAFRADPSAAAHLDDIDLPLVLAIASRESTPGYAHILLDGGDRRVIPAGGADSVDGGCGGLDFSADHAERIPESMRGDMTPVPESGLSDAGRRRASTPHPLEMPEADVLAAYIAEVHERQAHFEQRVREHAGLTADQAAALLAHLSRDARRAWTQVEFGTNAGSAYTRVWQRFDRAMEEHGFEAAAADDSVNLNSIVTDTVMADRRGVSGHRVRITMTEAAILDRMLPPELGGEGLTAPDGAATRPTQEPAPRL